MKGGVNPKTIIVMVIVAAVGVLSVFGVNTVRTYMSSASGGMDPKSVLAKPNDDGKTAVITWVSDKPSIGVVEYGTTPASLLLRAVETDSVTEHRITLSPLKPNVNYYFRIRVGEETYDNSGIPYSFKTKGSSEATGAAPTVPPAVPTVALMPTAAASSQSGIVQTPITGTCNRTTDYNHDGVINTVDYLNCMKVGAAAVSSTPSASPVVTLAPAATSSSGTCAANVDYDGNGVVNSLDRIKCLQNKK